MGPIPPPGEDPAGREPPRGGACPAAWSLPGARPAGHNGPVKLAVPLLAVLALSPALAVTVGDTLESVVAEKGQPLSTATAGSVRILAYPDAVIRLKDGVVVSVRAPEKTPAAPVAAPPSDGPAAWETDAGAAMDQAKARNCRVLILFTGSDWCPWCKKMDAEVYSRPEFASFSRRELVLLKLDFPRHTAQADALRRQNADLRERYGVNGFPTAVLVDATGRVVTKIEGYRQGGPAHFIEMLRSVN